jgi:hypothetical protein
MMEKGSETTPLPLWTPGQKHRKSREKRGGSLELATEAVMLSQT